VGLFPKYICCIFYKWPHRFYECKLRGACWNNSVLENIFSKFKIKNGKKSNWHKMTVGLKSKKIDYFGMVYLFYGMYIVSF